jgi:hypothetical protein
MMRHFLRSASITTLPIRVAEPALAGVLIPAPRFSQRPRSSGFPALIRAIRMSPVAARTKPEHRATRSANHPQKLHVFLALPEPTWEKPSVATTPGVPADSSKSRRASPFVRSKSGYRSRYDLAQQPRASSGSFTRDHAHGMIEFWRFSMRAYSMPHPLRWMWFNNVERA